MLPVGATDGWGAHRTPDTTEARDMTDDQGLSRRDFLRSATLVAVGAAATGGGAAYLRSRQQPAVITALPDAAATPVLGNPSAGAGLSGAPAAAASAPNVAGLIAANPEEALARLAEAQAENMNLRAQLDLALQELAVLRENEAGARSARDMLQMELDGANGRLGILGGLVALYQQLDELDPSEAVENGLGALGARLAELVDGTPLLNSGLDAGALALADVEAHMPLLDSGRQWLTMQGLKVQGFYADVERVLQEVLERAGDFFQMINEWLEGLRKWLPFGAGEKAARVVASLTALIGETPGTLAGLDVNVGQPLDNWVGREEGEYRLTRRLVRPMRDEVIARARLTIDQTHQTNAVFNDQLAAPVRGVLASRQTVREAIAAYRQQHQI
jgi:hypothetical protein